MGRTRKYPLELRERSVRMVRESGRTIRHVAKDLGVHHEALRLWVRKAEADATPAASRVLPTEVEQELKTLRKRNAELERSCQILRDDEFTGEIHLARAGYRRVYGARRTWCELGRRGVEVGRDRIARIMCQEGLHGVIRGRRHQTTIRDESLTERARDLVDRNFTATGPNELWVGDFTYLRTLSGFLYLSFILDVFSRLIVGWQLAAHRRATLVIDALEMAAGLRRPPGGLVNHTDAGSQYTSVTYTDRLIAFGMRPSIGSVGDAYDNAMDEAFVGTIKSELIQGRIMPSFAYADQEILPWISWYNRDRLHQELGYLSPVEFEGAYAASGSPAGSLVALGAMVETL